LGDDAFEKEIDIMKYAQIIVEVSASEVDRVFDYACEDALSPGYRVLVPFGKSNKPIEGYVLHTKQDTDFDKSKIKAVIRVLDEIPVISPELLQVAAQVKQDYNLKMVDILRLFIPAQMRGGRIKELKRFFVGVSEEYKKSTLDDLFEKKLIKPSAQNRIDVFCYLQEKGDVPLSVLEKTFSTSAINALVTLGVLHKQMQSVGRVPYANQPLQDKGAVVLLQSQCDAIAKIEGSQKMVTVLHGVTGSGKTEVYLALIEKTLRANKTAIMLVPEIGLTPQALRIFRNKFGESVAILHSGLSAGERFDEWKRLLLGQATVAIGARSAIFAPLQNIGIIIIDEEHDSSYLSENNPRYDTKEIAKLRASHHLCKLVLGSATPSIDTYQKATVGEYDLAEMPHRINNKALPPLQIVDMREEIAKGNHSALSETLLYEIDQTLAQNNKIMLFINRRGYASYLQCGACGYVAKCSDCDVSLVYHRDENVLKCHFCNNRFALLELCPECKSNHFRRGFVGTEKIVENLQEHFAGKTKILRMDNDTVQKKDGHLEILDKFATAEYNILVGTQMIVKGHDFNNVALVGILDADMSLHFNDYKAVERTFQLITQASGRAGRAAIDGKVILQTYTPKHYVYHFASNGDYKNFFAKECNLREITKYPPFSVLVRVLVSGQDEIETHTLLRQVFDKIVDISKQKRGFLYLSCMRSPIKRIQKSFRMQVLCRLEMNSSKELLQDIYHIVNRHNSTKNKIFVEINPSNLS